MFTVRFFGRNGVKVVVTDDPSTVLELFEMWRLYSKSLGRSICPDRFPGDFIVNLFEERMTYQELAEMPADWLEQRLRRQRENEERQGARIPSYQGSHYAIDARNEEAIPGERGCSDDFIFAEEATRGRPVAEDGSTCTEEVIIPSPLKFDDDEQVL